MLKETTGRISQLSGIEWLVHDVFFPDHKCFLDNVARGGSQKGAIGAIAPLKPAKVTLFTMILYNSENNIRDIRPFCRPLFGHITAVL